MTRRSLTRIILIAVSVPLALWLWARFVASTPESSFVPVALDDMVLVEGGRHFGRDLRDYYIDRYEVTEADYRRFAEVTGQTDPMAGKDERRAPDYPIRHVPLSAAEAFAAWEGKRLPTNGEWDRASLGKGGSPFPWGTGYLPLANTAEAWENRGFENLGVVRVGIFAQGRSAVGAQDMVGNVREWTVSSFEEALRDDRARRFALESERDGREDELNDLLLRLENRGEAWVWREPRTPIESPAELQPDPTLSREARLRLIDLLPVLTPVEELDFRRETGFNVQDDQYVMNWLSSESVTLDNLVEDRLAYESPDPRLLPVLGPLEVEVLVAAGGVPTDGAVVLEPRTPLGRDDYFKLLPVESRVAPPDLDLEPGLELLPVRRDTEDRRLNTLAREVDLELASIVAWREEFAEFIRLRQASFAGERHVIVRGGSFRTRIKGGAVVLEDIENAGNAAWDLGFRCVVSREEAERQHRIAPLIRDLGWRDPWNYWFRARRARRALVAAGAGALPYLERARENVRHAGTRSRLEAVIAEIETSE